MTSSDDPISIRAAIWAALHAAVQDKKHPWRSPALATSRADGSAAMRTVILREVDENKGQLVFYTDNRSAKCQQIIAHPMGEIMFWHPGMQWQLRAEVKYQLLTKGPQIEQRWQQIAASPAANDYLSALSPGAHLSSLQTQVLKQPHFAIIIAEIQQLDWLALSRSGHRRALLTAQQFAWLVP